MDHADPGGDRVAGRVDVDGRPSTSTVPASGPVEPVEDVHQRRLAGAVAADQAVDLAGGQLKSAPSSATTGPNDLRDTGHPSRRAGPGRSSAPTERVRSRHSTGVTSRSTSISPVAIFCLDASHQVDDRLVDVLAASGCEMPFSYAMPR